MSVNVQSSEVYVPLADGGVRRLKLTATVLKATGRHGINHIQCAMNLRAHRSIIQEIINQARMSEFNYDSRYLVSIEIDPLISNSDSDNWQLALVLADKYCRGILSAPASRIYALGQAEDWMLCHLKMEKMDIQLRALEQLLPAIQPGDRLILASVDTPDWQTLLQQFLDKGVHVHCIDYLNALLGHPNPEHLQRQASVFFPLVSSVNGVDCSTLESVSISVLPLAAGTESLNEPVEFSGGINKSMRDEIRQILEAARSMDGSAASQWLTRVSFSQKIFSDNSFELALVLADRIARGKEVTARGKLIATGCSNNWSCGRIDPVGALEQKFELFKKQCVAGDRVLVPGLTQQAKSSCDVYAQSIADLTQKGVSVACIHQLLVFDEAQKTG